jgi:hypothetical protein
MESLDELTKTGSSKTGFFKHVFNFNDESKEEICNIVQYAITALVPVVVLNKGMQRFVPEADEDKGSLEILAEIVIQITVLFMGILFIHRIITYIPTYSGAKYGDFNVTNIILATLVIILSLQTKLGEKVSILVDRLTELWEGPKQTNDKKKAQNKKNSSVNNSNNNNSSVSSQSQNDALGQSLMSMGSTSIQQLPNTQAPPQLPDYNSMYKQENTPLVNASVPGSSEGFGGIMAANEALGGGGFGGSNW